MEGERYQELEDRRRMLKLFRDKLEEARDEGTHGLDLQVCEQGDDIGIIHTGIDRPVILNSVGKELGMSGAHTVALFERIRDRFLIGRLHNQKPILPIYNAELRNLSDEGKMMLNLLPQDQLIAALREVIETAKDPETPGSSEDKRDAVAWANDGITLAQKIAWLADKLATLT
jgi:hypothetical protein